MPVVVGIRFKDSGKTYFFDPNGFNTLTQGDSVIVETVRGLELAKVAYAPHDVDQSEIVGDLRPVIRRAEQSDFDRMRLLAERHDEVMARCAEKIGEHSLAMRWKMFQEVRSVFRESGTYEENALPDVPVTLFRGERSPIGSREMIRALSVRHPKARVVEALRACAP